MGDQEFSSSRDHDPSTSAAMPKSAAPDALRDRVFLAIRDEVQSSLFYAPNSKDVLVIDVEALGDFIQELTDRALKASAARDMYEALKVAAKAELYDEHTGIVDADVLEIVQDVARAAIAIAEGR